MAKLDRIFQKLFGSSGVSTDFGKFGSLADGSPVTTKDPALIQDLPEFLSGWKDAVLATNRPTLEDRNALDLLIFRQIGYLFQEGIAEYDSSTEYHQNSIVKEVGTTKIYASKINTNVGNALVNGTNWGLLFDMSQVREYYADSGSADAYVLGSIPSDSQPPSEYFEGMKVSFVAGNENTGASTINVSGLGVKNIKLADGTNPLSGDIVVEELTVLYYDGTNFVVIQSKKATAVGVEDGTIAHGGTIPLVAGWTEGQSKWMVSVSDIGTPSGGDGDNIEEILCSANGTRVVTCKVWIRTNVAYVNGTANYIIVGVK